MPFLEPAFPSFATFCRIHAALARLREGNARFVEGTPREVASSHARRAALASAQRPFAIVLGCPDSRVPAEVVFDQGRGDLFVIRVAGNIVAPSQVGSVEFAAARFDTRLVVVLGHTQCGAILATLDEVRNATGEPPNLMSIVDRIRPSVETLIRDGRLTVVGAEYSLETGRVEFFDSGTEPHPPGE